MLPVLLHYTFCKSGFSFTSFFLDTACNERQTAREKRQLGRRDRKKDKRKKTRLCHPVCDLLFSLGCYAKAILLLSTFSETNFLRHKLSTEKKQFLSSSFICFKESHMIPSVIIFAFLTTCGYQCYQCILTRSRKISRLDLDKGLLKELEKEMEKNERRQEKRKEEEDEEYT